jgi:hypothetical protein
MAAAAAEFVTCAHRATEITRASSLLIDDTRKNIEIALNHYVRALLFNPDQPERSVYHFLNSFLICCIFFSVLQDIIELGC